MISKITIVLGFLLASSAFADFNGTWQGEADVQMKDGSRNHCSSFAVTIEQSSTEFKIQSMDFQCEQFSHKEGPYVLSIQGMYLYYQNQQVGMIMGDDVQIQYNQVSDHGNVSWDYQFSQQNGVASYVEHIKSSDGLVTINGSLKKQ